MRPSRSDTLLQIVTLIAQRSTCNRLAVGALIAREGRILTTGYNGPPSGMSHCEHPKFPLLKDDTCRIAVHAEQNAIAFAARYGMSTEGAELFVTHSPCVACAQSIVQAGVIKVYYLIEYRDLTGLDLLELVGIEARCGPE